MESKIRNSGIDVIGNTPWGTHFCLFYQTKEDLIDILVPYFKAGLENNEYCMWVTSEPLNEKNVEKAIRVAMPNFDEYLKKKQIEIIPYTDWYLRDNTFDFNRVLNGWIEKLENAVENGFEGLRITGNTAWLEKKDWNEFCEYEEEINNVIGNFQMIAICTYSLEKCGSFELLDVLQNHQFALIRRESSWEIFKNSEQIKIEQQLKESEEKYRNFVQNIQGIAFQGSKDFSITFIDGAVEEITGYTSEDFETGRMKWNQIIYPDDALTIGKKVELFHSTSAETEILEYRIMHKNGEIRWVLNPIRKIYDKIKKMEDFQGIVVDITQRKKAEIELKDLNKMKSEFLRRASHELKTPLISIKGFSDLILDLYIDQLDPVIISKLREINDGCERLQNIINNLLETSRLKSPQLKPKLQKENLSFLIKFCVNELESLADIRNQSIKLDIQDDLYAYIEKEEIHDVLSNLLTNAIKYTPPTGKIEITSELKEDLLVISIKDNGIGFTNEQKKKIFQQFGKIERYGQGLDLGIDGTGLGLFISKKIVESHGGEIWMESEGKSKGSVFYFTLPTVKY